MNNGHYRRSIRLKGYDYTQAGAYFVTIVVQGRECRLGTISGGGINLKSIWQDRSGGVGGSAQALPTCGFRGILYHA